MSQIFDYFRKFFHSSSNQDRKRRRAEIPETAPQFPKYRRVSNNFPKQYNCRIDDETDHFQQVKQKQQCYNEILENFVMEQQNHNTRQIRTVNEDRNNEEFSDEEDFRMPSTTTSRRPNAMRPSSSGYNFSSGQSAVSGIISPSTSFNFSQKSSSRKDDDVRFVGVVKKSIPKRRDVPDLLPLSHDASHKSSNGFMNNRCTNGMPQFSRRRSIFDFKKKNRAFDETSSCKFSTSIIDREHNLETKTRYDNLLRKLIPRTADKAKYSNCFSSKPQEKPVVTVDLSFDETETNAVADAFSEDQQKFTANRYSSHNRSQKKPAFVDLSSDDDDCEIFGDQEVISSTLIKSKPMLGRQRKSEPSSVIPEIAPVNSLKERQQSLSCLQKDAIESIVNRYKDRQSKNNSAIQDAKKDASNLSRETAEQEKQYQRKIDDTLNSMKHCIILDEEDAEFDEYPPLTEQQLRVIQFGLHGSRGEIISQKFNMNITRQDLNTLDGLNWLNDEVINFYMELLKLRSEEVEGLPKVHAMNTFFIPKLLQMGHAGVRRWTRKVDIFSYDIIPVPVHVGGVHWCMSIINLRDKTIRYYDSMGHPNQPVLDALERYLRDESMDKRKIHFDTSDFTIECVRDCPQQRNGSDCGVFSCMFAEFLCRDSKISFDQTRMQYFRRKMVYEIAQGKLVLGYD